MQLEILREREEKNGEGRQGARGKRRVKERDQERKRVDGKRMRNRPRGREGLEEPPRGGWNERGEESEVLSCQEEILSALLRDDHAQLAEGTERDGARAGDTAQSGREGSSEHRRDETTSDRVRASVCAR